VKASLLAAVGVLALLFVVPALADDSPSVAACKAEYQQLGQAGFAAKYGAGEAGYKACVQAHGGTAPKPPAQNGDSGPVAACKTEYQQLGGPAFFAKYGTGEAGFKACVQAHGGTVPTTPPTNGGDSAAVAACKAEYQQLGASGFAAKYGANEPYRACIQAHGGTPPPPGPGNGEKKPDLATGVAGALCAAEAKSLGKDGFQSKYGSGKDGYSACLQAQAAKAQSILSTCQSSAGSDTKALEACLKQALGLTSGGGDQKKQPDYATGIAGALCAAEAKSLGKDGFQSKYGTGKDGLSACVHAQAPKAQSILAACKASAGSSADAFKQCVYAAVKPGAR
jgi:hypothetical protein